MIVSRQIPRQSVLFESSARASYQDCAAHPLPADCRTDALGLYLATTRPAPWWLNALLAVRDALVRPFGLKTVGGFGTATPASARLGETLDLFTIGHLSDDEIMLFIRDSHLDVCLSFMRMEEGGHPVLVASTIVTIHNRLGRIYMLPVGPFHRLLVKYFLVRARAGILNGLGRYRRRLTCRP